MGSSEQMYNRIGRGLEELITPSHIFQLTNMIWIVVGIVQQKSVALSQIAQSIPGETQAQSRVTKIRRWLSNPKIEVWQFYWPILEKVLRGWQNSDVSVIVDGTSLFGSRFQLFRLSLVHGCRAIPIIWTVLPGKGLTQVECLEEMFEKAAQFFSTRVRTVTLLADRGFRDCDWAQLCLRLGWHYVIRIANNTTVWLPNGIICSIEELGIKVSKPRFFDSVGLTLEGEFETNLSVTWTEDKKELLALISDKPANRARLSNYRLRMQIEESFKDDKSSGFDMEHTRLSHPDRIERLLLCVAIATVYCHEIGEFCLKAGDSLRRIIDPGRERELSIFQLGLRFLHRCLATALVLIPIFKLRLHPIKLKPVVNSYSFYFL